MLQTGSLLQPERAFAKALRLGRLAALLQQQRQVDEDLVVMRVEIKSLAITALGLRRIAARVADEAHQMKDLRGWP